MTDNKQGFDLIGLGKAMEAIPDEAWVQLVKTATDTFEKALSPITEFTSGLGRWIRQKFDNKVAIEKVLLADGLAKAVERVSESNTTFDPKVNLRVCGDILDNVAATNEQLIRDLWINLLARELTDDSVHPEFVNILSRLSTADANLLLKIAAESQSAQIRIAMSRALNRATQPASGIWQSIFREEFNLSIEVLLSLNLVRVDSGHKVITKFGERFLESVSEPTTETDPNETA